MLFSACSDLCCVCTCLYVPAVPTINLSPNSSFVGVNLSASFINPDLNDTCPMFMEKNLAYLTQANATAGGV